MTTRRTLLFLLVAFVLTVGACQVLNLRWGEETQASRARELLTDDPRPEQPRPLVEGLVDSRTLAAQQEDGTTVEFEVNASPAVVALDVRDIRSDEDAALLDRHAHFASAARAIEAAGFEVLPSVNVLDAKAKQIDDGLMAALEVHLVFGAGGIHGPDGAGGQVVEFVRALRDAAGVDAHAWLTASLVLAGVEDGDAASQTHVDRFRADIERSKPIGFHEWSPQLEAAFRCLRFLQEPLSKAEPLHDALERALAGDADLSAQHERLLDIQRLASNHAALPAIGVGASTAALLPPRTSRELDLVGRLAAFGAPPGVNLMEQLVLAIQGGRIDLTPTQDGGWYEHRAFALEVFLLPERAYEHDKLVLSRRYKQRLIEAYQTRVTAVLETHSTYMVASAAHPPGDIEPRLRVEPCATYALRLAQSYAFIEGVLREYTPELLDRPGLCESGPRVHALADELVAAQRLFLGVHLVVCEDLGLAPTIAASERSLSDHTAARTAAAEWLATWTDDPDLAVDARLAFPVAFESVRGVRTWCNVGVRAIRLQARFVHAPHVRPAAAPGAAAEPWQPVGARQTRSAEWILLAEEFEELTFDAPPTRTEFRRFLDRR